jgi:tetratricopeptide (TPR) repeat protein
MQPSRYVPRRAAALVVLLALVALLAPRAVCADEFDRFAYARNAYEAGEYEAAVTRFEALLASEPRNPALVLEAYKLLGVSYLFVGNKERAEETFIKLLTRSPEYTLDPLVFPIDVVDFFTVVKDKNDEQIAALAAARAAEEEARREAEEAARQAALEKLKRNVYIERSRRENSLLVAMLPLGAGQFQNGDNLKGALFLGGEVLLGATALTTYILHEGLRPRSERPFSSPSDRKAYEQLEKGYRITNQASLVALGVLTTIGIIDALYGFERETVTWHPVKEKDVPDELRYKPVAARLMPVVGDSMVGLGAAGTF